LAFVTSASASSRSHCRRRRLFFRVRFAFKAQFFQPRVDTRLCQLAFVVQGFGKQTVFARVFLGVDLFADVAFAFERDHLAEACARRNHDRRLEAVKVGIFVRDVFDEQHEQHIVPVLTGVHPAAQFIARSPERRVEVRFFDDHCFCVASSPESLLCTEFRGRSNGACFLVAIGAGTFACEQRCDVAGGGGERAG
jgi:hypothetical protein